MRTAPDLLQAPVVGRHPQAFRAQPLPTHSLGHRRRATGYEPSLVSQMD